jgi:hypothetical protein
MSKGEKLPLENKEKTPLQKYYQWERLRKSHVAKCIQAVSKDSNIEPRLARGYEMILQNLIDGEFPNVEVTPDQQKQYMKLIDKLQKKYPDVEAQSLEQSYILVKSDAEKNPISQEEVEKIIKKNEDAKDLEEKHPEKEVASGTYIEEDLGMSMVFVARPASAEEEKSKEPENRRNIPAPVTSYAKKAMESAGCVIS